ncbi:methyltransferase [Iodidimonas muriae]|nr:methyltransferase [Iodidimonas muriae]
MTSDLHRARLQIILDAIRKMKPRSVMDLGCGDGALLLDLVKDRSIERIIGIDQSRAAIEALRHRLAAFDADLRERVTIRLGSMIEPQEHDRQIDLAVMCETIEHIAPSDLSRLEKAVFIQLMPATILISTPNREFNDLLGVPSHRFRHPDHRFEWDRSEFCAWASRVAGRCGYDVDMSDLGGAHPLLGGPSQMAVFRKAA